MPYQAVRVDRLQMRRHRGLAVGRDPGHGEAAILTRSQSDGALARLLEDEGVIIDMALAEGPGCRVLVIDARPDRVDGGQVIAMHGLDAEQHFSAVRIKAVPGVAKTLRRLTGVATDP